MAFKNGAESDTHTQANGGLEIEWNMGRERWDLDRRARGRPDSLAMICDPSQVLWNLKQAVKGGEREKKKGNLLIQAVTSVTCIATPSALEDVCVCMCVCMGVSGCCLGRVLEGKKGGSGLGEDLTGYVRRCTFSWRKPTAALQFYHLTCLRGICAKCCQGIKVSQWSLLLLGVGLSVCLSVCPSISVFILTLARKSNRTLCGSGSQQSYSHKATATALSGVFTSTIWSYSMGQSQWDFVLWYSVCW